MERTIFLFFFLLPFGKQDMLLRRVRIAAKGACYFDHICASQRGPTGRKQYDSSDFSEICREITL